VRQNKRLYNLPRDRRFIASEPLEYTVVAVG
jgi:hypothetical protein